MEKLLFLDFDGVVSNLGPDRHEKGKTFSQDYMEKLKGIICSTHAKIVLCSVWRDVLLNPFDEATKEFLSTGIDFSGITPIYDSWSIFFDTTFLKENGNIVPYTGISRGDGSGRSQEIRDFINFYENFKKIKLESWCVIDDEKEHYVNNNDVIPFFSGKLVLTTGALGITENSKNQAIEILGKRK